MDRAIIIRTAVAVCFFFVIGGIAAAQPATPQTAVNGWIEVKGTRHPLTHVFAMMEPDKLEEGNKENVVLLLSDLAVSDAMRVSGGNWEFWAAEQARAGSLHGLTIIINPEIKVWSRGQWLMSQGMMLYTHTSTDPEGRVLRFEPAAAGQDEIAGKVWMKEPMEGMGDGPWRVEAEFRTPVIPMPKITASISGAAALKSPQYQAVVAFLKACQKKDLDAIRMSMDPASQDLLAEAVKQQGREAALEMFAGMAAESLNLKTVQVTVRGPAAEVSLSESKKGERTAHTLKVALVNGVWKLTR